MPRLDDDALFDRRMSYVEFDGALEQDLQGQTFQVCTVRQSKLNNVALGNLFWLLQAAKAKRRGAEVVVTDFYDKRDSSNQGIVDLMEILGMKDAEGVTFRRAEDVKDGFLWADLSAHVREVGEEGLEWAMIGNVRKGIRDTLETPWRVPASMDRLLEELSVWVDGIDSDSVTQLMNHEVQSTRWMRVLRPDADKQFWQVQLPFENEYRGRYRDVAGPEPEIVQRRLQDLAGKLAIGRTGGQPEEHAEFYEALFRDLVEVLDFRFRDEVDREGFYGPFQYKYSHVPKKIVEAVFQIDPRLALFLVDIFQPDDEGKSAAKIVGEAIPDAGDHRQSAVIKMIQGVKMIGDAELASEQPSFRRVIDSAGVLMALRANQQKKLVVYDKGLNTMLLDERWSITELFDYWIEFLNGNNDMNQAKFWAHPVVVRLASSEDLPVEKWLEMRAIYEKQIFTDRYGFLPRFANPLDMVVVKRVIDEIFEEDIDKVRQLLWDFYANRGNRDQFLRLGSAGERDIIIYLTEKYLEASQDDERTVGYYQRHLDKLNAEIAGVNVEWDDAPSWSMDF